MFWFGTAFNTAKNSVSLILHSGCTYAYANRASYVVPTCAKELSPRSLACRHSSRLAEPSRGNCIAARAHPKRSRSMLKIIGITPPGSSCLQFQHPCLCEELTPLISSLGEGRIVQIGLQPFSLEHTALINVLTPFAASQDSLRVQKKSRSSN